MKIKKTIWTASKEKTITDEYKNTQIKIAIIGSCIKVKMDPRKHSFLWNNSIFLARLPSIPLIAKPLCIALIGLNNKRHSVSLSDNVFIPPHCALTNRTRELWKTKIIKNKKIANRTPDKVINVEVAKLTNE